MHNSRIIFKLKLRSNTIIRANYLMKLVSRTMSQALILKYLNPYRFRNAKVTSLAALPFTNRAVKKIVLHLAIGKGFTRSF